MLGDALLEVHNLRELLVRLGHVPGSVQEGTVQEEGVRSEEEEKLNPGPRQIQKAVEQSRGV